MVIGRGLSLWRGCGNFKREKRKDTLVVDTLCSPVSRRSGPPLPPSIIPSLLPIRTTSVLAVLVVRNAFI